MEVKTVVKNYLAIFHLSDNKSDLVKRLILSLDELAFVANKVNYIFDEKEYPDPPKNDYKTNYQDIKKLFPSIGLDTSGKTQECSLVTANAIDDIIDITHDLKEVFWRFENTSENDALFYFQFLFRSHWGQHLRSLQLYLHDFYW